MAKFYLHFVKWELFVMFTVLLQFQDAKMVLLTNRSFKQQSYKETYKVTVSIDMKIKQIL